MLFSQDIYIIRQNFCEPKTILFCMVQNRQKIVFQIVYEMSLIAGRRLLKENNDGNGQVFTYKTIKRCLWPNRWIFLNLLIHNFSNSLVLKIFPSLCIHIFVFSSVVSSSNYWRISSCNLFFRNIIVMADCCLFIFCFMSLLTSNVGSRPQMFISTVLYPVLFLLIETMLFILSHHFILFGVSFNQMGSPHLN